LFSALVLTSLVWLRGESLTWRRNYRIYLILGLLNSAIPFSLFAWASLSLQAGTLAIVNSSTPMMTAILGALLLSEPISIRRWLGMGFAVVGIALASSSKAGHLGEQAWLGTLAAFLASTCYAVASIYAKKRTNHLSSVALATGSQQVAALLLVPFAWMNFQRWPGTLEWFAIAGLGLFPTALMLILFYYLLARVPASKAMSSVFLIPVFGIFWGTLLLDEAVSGVILGGALLTILGTALIVRAR
jgi:drug/metabolite transporter (DMT)-like permease